MELHSPLYFLSPVIDIKRHDACVATICERIIAVSAKVPARVTPLPSCIVVSLEIHLVFMGGEVTAPIPNALNAFPAQIEGPPPECIGIVFFTIIDELNILLQGLAFLLKTKKPRRAWWYVFVYYKKCNVVSC